MVVLVTGGAIWFGAYTEQTAATAPSIRAADGPSVPAESDTDAHPSTSPLVNPAVPDGVSKDAQTRDRGTHST